MFSLKATASSAAALALLATCWLLLAPPLANAASPGFIEGTVTDAATHQPLKDINVCAYATGGGSSCTLTDSGGSGEYLIAVDPGEYRVGFSSIDHIYLTQFYNGRETEEDGDLISVGEGATTSGIDAAMVEGGKIAGTVTSANGGAPVKGFDACALEASGAGSIVSCALTDASGEYTIPELPGGSYKVEFSPGFCFECGSQTYFTQFYSGKESWAEADPVSVTLGETTSGIDVQLVPSKRLKVSPAGAGAGTVTSSPDGINCGSKCSHAFAEGSAVTLTAEPAPGSVFGGWSDGCSGTGACHVTMSANTNVTAIFNKVAPPPPSAQTLAIKFAGTGKGGVSDATGAISCPSTCSHAYVAGTLVTLAATPAPGSTFAGWSGGGCSGTGACQLSVNADTTLTASFEKAPPTRSRPHVLVSYRQTGGIGGLRPSLVVYKDRQARVKLGGCTAKFVLGHRIWNKLRAALRGAHLHAIAGNYPPPKGSADEITYVIRSGANRVRIASAPQSKNEEVMRDLRPLLKVLNRMVSAGERRMPSSCKGSQ